MCDIENRNIETEIIIDNQSDSEDIQNIDISDVVVYARDWTIETIFNQINLKSATTRLYDTEAKIICIVSKKGAQCIECHHKDI